MEFAAAEKIYDEAISMDTAIGRIDTIISDISEGNEKSDWVSRLGNVMRSINEELITPILKTYPELDRDMS